MKATMPQNETAPEQARNSLVLDSVNYELQPDGRLWTYCAGHGGFWLTQEETSALIAWIKGQPS